MAGGPIDIDIASIHSTRVVLCIIDKRYRYLDIHPVSISCLYVRSAVLAAAATVRARALETSKRCGEP